jgi:peptide/nickel transport system permease protein
MSVGAPELLVDAEAAAEAGLEPVGDEIAARSPIELFWRRFRQDRVAIASLAFIALLVLAAIFAPLIIKLVGAPGPNVQNSNALDQFGTPTGPSLAHNHLFGVDPLGRDVFARVLYGARVSLEVALVATGISMIIGVTAGMVAGFFRGWVDMLISRLIDVLLAFPILLLGLGLAAACSLGKGCLGGVIKPGLGVVIFVIAFVNWTYIGRIVRGQVLSLREKEFIEAARSLGASNRRIIFREVLPNLVAPIIVYATLIIPTNILFEAALSFLGVGVQPPHASWGAMLADATAIFNTAWWYMLFPGAALLLTVLAFNLVGDGLQDALNPKAARS